MNAEITTMLAGFTAVGKGTEDLRRPTMTVTSKTKRGRGRPPKEIPKIDASPERVARAIFSAVKPSDPSL